jgi:hypothetical protein
MPSKMPSDINAFCRFARVSPNKTIKSRGCQQVKMKNFDAYLRCTIRKEPVDWSEHYVDYDILKARRLSTF